MIVSRLLELEPQLPEEARAERVQVLCALADDASHALLIEAALDYSERALVIAQTTEGDDSVRPAAASRAFALMLAGRHFEGRLFLDAGVEMARRGGSPFDQARAFMYFGVSVMEDDPRASLEAMLECAVLTSKAGVRPVQGLALANASEGAVDLGEWDIADRALDEMAELTRGESIDDDGATFTRAMLTAHRGDPEGGARRARRPRVTAEQHVGRRPDAHVVPARPRAVPVPGRRPGRVRPRRHRPRCASTRPAATRRPRCGWPSRPRAHGATSARSATALEATAALRGHWTALVRATAIGGDRLPRARGRRSAPDDRRARRVVLRRPSAGPRVRDVVRGVRPPAGGRTDRARRPRPHLPHRSCTPHHCSTCTTPLA